MIFFVWIPQGAFGIVFRVMSETKKRYACKIVKLDDHDAVPREINIHGKLIDMNVVRFEEYFESDGLGFMLMEFCSNRCLMEYCEHFGALSIELYRFIVKGILDGLAFIHGKGYLHRDMKLNNCVLNEYLRVKICDFGLSIRIDDPKCRTKHRVGTPNYFSPG